MYLYKNVNSRRFHVIESIFINELFGIGSDTIGNAWVYPVEKHPSEIQKMLKSDYSSIHFK